VKDRGEDRSEKNKKKNMEIIKKNGRLLTAPLNKKVKLSL
jgi:hypothetical protein